MKSRGAWTPLKLAQRLEPYGFKITPIKTDVSELSRQKFPGVVAWQDRATLVLGMSPKGIILKDPSLGIFEVLKKDFADRWNQVLLTHQRVRVGFCALSEAWSSARGLILSISALSSVAIAVGLIFLWFSQQLVDRAIGSATATHVNSLMAGAAALALFGASISILRSRSLSECVGSGCRQHAVGSRNAVFHGDLYS